MLPDLVVDLDVGSPPLLPFMHLATELPSGHLVFPYEALHSLFLNFNSHFIRSKLRQPAFAPAALVPALKQGWKKAASRLLPGLNTHQLGGKQSPAPVPRPFETVSKSRLSFCGLSLAFIYKGWGSFYQSVKFSTSGPGSGSAERKFRSLLPGLTGKSPWLS